MPVFQVPPDALRTGHPTPFALRDAAGQLLVARGVMVESDAQREQLVARELFVDEQEGETFRRAMAGQLDLLVRQNATLGEMASAHPGAPPPAEAARRVADPAGAWSSLQMRTSAMMREAPPQADFAARLHKLQAEVAALVAGDADAALLVLVHATTSDIHHYSATHSLLVAVVCELAARQIVSWPAACRPALRSAALAMNVAMTGLQDALAVQDTPPTAPQRAQIDGHAERGAALLREAGVADELLLQAIAQHHATPPGALGALPVAHQLARLIQRADIFAARLSPRRRRQALSGTAAAQAAYLDERKQPDEAGAAIVKAVGIYPPGSYVQLASGEIAVVLKRGRRANEPVVASIVGRHGNTLGEPALRDTQRLPYRVTAGIAPHDVKVRLSVERLLRLG